MPGDQANRAYLLDGATGCRHTRVHMQHTHTRNAALMKLSPSYCPKQSRSYYTFLLRNHLGSQLPPFRPSGQARPQGQTGRCIRFIPSILVINLHDHASSRFKERHVALLMHCHSSLLRFCLLPRLYILSRVGGVVHYTNGCTYCDTQTTDCDKTIHSPQLTDTGREVVPESNRKI